MIPESNLNELKIIKQPSFTYKLDINKEIVRNYTDNLEAVKQAVYKILNTERYENIIYSWNYGIELNDLFGRSRDYVYSELPQRIIDALTHDDRILSVENFVFENTKRGIISVKFDVYSTAGEFETGLEVNI